jgi:O-antigen/teichoic acid export membrane protein
MNILSSNRIDSMLRRLRSSQLARNTVAMLAGSGTRLLIQAIYFILIARALGAGQYGAFVGVAALVTILSPYSAMGTGQIIIRNVARDRKTLRYSWGNALWMTAVSGLCLLGLVSLVARFVFGSRVSLWLVIEIGVSDLLFATVARLAGQAFQAVEQLHRTAQIQIVLAAVRGLAAVALILIVRHPTALIWAFFYCSSSLLAAIYAFMLACSELGYPKLLLRRVRSDLLEGVFFAISLSSASIYDNIDRTMLARLATFGSAGVYGAAYRVVDFSFQPVAALLASAYARFFQHGVQGILGTTRFAKRLLPYAAVYGALASALLFAGAPVLSFVLGRDFAESATALRWLSPIVLLRAVHYLLADSLTGAGLQGLRSAIQILTQLLVDSPVCVARSSFGEPGIRRAACRLHVARDHIKASRGIVPLRASSPGIDPVMRTTLDEADISSNHLGLAERALTAMILLLSTGAFMNLGVVDSAGGPVAGVRVLWYVAYLVIGALFLSKCPRKGRFLFAVAPLVPVVAFAMVSSSWSQDPALSFRHSVVLVITVLFGFYFASRFNLEEQLRLLAWVFGTCIIFSFVFGLLGIGTAVDADLNVPGWYGVFIQKNVLGRTMVLSMLVFLFWKRVAPEYRTMARLGLFASLALVVLSRSMTSVVT